MRESGFLRISAAAPSENSLRRYGSSGSALGINGRARRGLGFKKSRARDGVVGGRAAGELMVEEEVARRLFPFDSAGTP
jgi:hypothetical protein